MPIQSLQLVPCLRCPNLASLVARSRDDLVTLRVELNLGNFVLVTLQQSDTGTSKHVIHAGNTISTGGCKFVSSSIEAGVKHFVIVTAESLNALASTNIPKLASSVDGAS